MLPAKPANSTTVLPPPPPWIQPPVPGLKESGRQDVFQEAQRRLCQHQAVHAHHVETRASTAGNIDEDGTFVNLGHGWTAVAAGQGWYRYQCRRLLATAVPGLQSCYQQDLPVRIPDEDRQSYLEQRQMTAANITHFFILSAGQRLHHQSSLVDCQQPLAPLYQNVEGTWLQARPKLQRRPPIQDFGHVERRLASSFPTTLGVQLVQARYTPLQVLAMDRFLHHLVIPTVADLEDSKHPPTAVTPWGPGGREGSRWPACVPLFTWLLVALSILSMAGGHAIRCKGIHGSESRCALASWMACWPGVVDFRLHRQLVRLQGKLSMFINDYRSPSYQPPEGYLGSHRVSAIVESRSLSVPVS